MKIVISVMTGLAIIAAAGGWYWHAHSTPAVIFRTAEVTRGDMVPTISATGTVEPQEVVDVGAQVAGLILTFGEDSQGKMVDYRSPVEAGTVLARIDPSLYAADLSNAQATLVAAKAGVTRAIADLGQMNAKLDQARSDWDRAQKLGPSDALSQSDYNTYKAAYGTAIANVAVDEAAIDQAKAAVVQDEAELLKAKQNVDYCTITSPVRGVIIDRRVNIGQTVVSSLNAPSLFLIAKDLTQIQVWVSVNEADIGSIYPGQPVTFTVDANPGESFVGSVGKVRLNASMTQNVVTYTVEVNTDNSDGRLLPYLTANVQFEVSRHKNVLLVPNAALRWYPELTMVAPDVRDALADEKKAAKNSREGAEDQPVARPKAKHGATTRATTGPAAVHPLTHATVWIEDGKYVRPIKVKAGATDGVMTEIVVKNDDVKEGMQLVTGEQHIQSTEEGTTNPFAPKPMWGKGHGH
jgi:HlyD family secretion protein